MYTSTFFVLCCLIGYSAAAKFPSDLPKCHFGDKQCLISTINLYAKALKNGRKELNIAPIDPLKVDEVNIVQGNSSPVNINLKFRDLLCFGLSDVVVKNVIGFERDLATSKFEIFATASQLSLVGQYKARGNILLLPISGSGAANLTFDNVDAHITIVPKVEIKRGKEYLHVSNILLDFTTTRLYMNFENLFNGDRVLGESTNQFLNQNWADILRELKPVLTEAIAKIYQSIAQPVFAKFPYADLFLDDNA